MRKSRIKEIFLAIFALIAGIGVSNAQTTDALGTFTPYSLYGIGEIVKQGTAINRGMGGIGVGVRDNRYINYVNPASITQRDTLAFMLDFGITQKNFYNSDGKSKSAYNTFNMHNVIFTAPIYKTSALIIGITPYSDVGYKFESTETDSELVSQYGDIKYQKYGTGSINQFFIGASMNFFKHFSVGAEYIYYFGALNRFSNVLFNSASKTMRTLETGWDYALGASSARVGLQYFGNLNKEKGVDLTVGATYRMATNLKGDFNRFAYAYDESIRDTIRNDLYEDAKIKIPQEFSVGFSIRKKDKWMFGFDYMRQDWTKSSFEGADGVKFKPCVAGYYKAGFEFIPNKYDIRYYMKRVTYRLGAYYEQSYVQLGSHQINAAGITFGMSLPIYRLYNAVNLAVDFGQRGTVKDNLVRERYVQFIVNISLHDIWFVKHQYQ